MIVVTGGAGFIGSNLIGGLNEQGYHDILAVDDLTDGHKFRNMAGHKIADYMDKEDFLALLREADGLHQVEAVFHQGACSVTTETDGRYMLYTNYEYSKRLWQACVRSAVPLIYASSAAVYGTGAVFSEADEAATPVNVYAYSKFLFDQYVRRSAHKANSQVVGLRYFNVFGPHEQHKAAMASVIYHFNQQLKHTGKVKLFKGSGGYADGEQRRDFIFVDDVVKVNLWFLQHPELSGIFNVGTGQAHSFNAVANAVISWHGRGEIEYIDFPQHLHGSYQSFTEADISRLREVGYPHEFTGLGQGVRCYLDWLNR